MILSRNRGGVVYVWKDLWLRKHIAAAPLFGCVCRLERDKELFRCGCIGDDALDKKGYYYSLTVDGDGCNSRTNNGGAQPETWVELKR